MTLSELMVAGIVVEVDHDGTVTVTSDHLTSDEPLVDMFGNEYNQTWYEWELVHELPNHHGAILHPTDTLSDTLEKHIRTTPGKWCRLNNHTPDGQSNGWALAYAPHPI